MVVKYKKTVFSIMLLVSLFCLGFNVSAKDTWGINVANGLGYE